MKARDESGINKDFPEKSTDWIATAVKRCTDDYSMDFYPLMLIFSSVASSMTYSYPPGGRNIALLLPMPLLV